MTVPPLSPTALAARADVVVEGVVTSARARWVGRRILTFYIVTPDGVGAPSIVVAVPGGVVGALGQRVPGAPVLHAGQRYRLHLGPADGPADVDGGPPSRGIIGFFRGVALLADHDGVRVSIPFYDDGHAQEPRP